MQQNVQIGSKAVIFQTTGSRSVSWCAAHVILLHSIRIASRVHFNWISDQFNILKYTQATLSQAAYRFKPNKRGPFIWLPFTFTIFLLFSIHECFYSPLLSLSLYCYCCCCFFHRISFPIYIINYVFVCARVLTTFAQLLNGGGKFHSFIKIFVFVQNEWNMQFKM